MYGDIFKDYKMRKICQLNNDPKYKSKYYFPGT